MKVIRTWFQSYKKQLEYEEREKVWGKEKDQILVKLKLRFVI